jgi:predicted nucleic acid-binding protein
MISTFTILIDANVFYGARLRSLVLYMAQTKMFRARWSEEINDEWVRNIHQNQAIALDKLKHVRDLVNASVLDCLVTGYKPLEAGLNLPDPGDRHVLAAALKTRADIIVTFNVKDFPASVLSPLGIEAKHPDDFLQDLFGISADIFIGALQEDFIHYRAPPLTFDQYVAGFQKAGVPKTASLIESLRVLLEP